MDGASPRKRARTKTGGLCPNTFVKESAEPQKTEYRASDQCLAGAVLAAPGMIAFFVA